MWLNNKKKYVYPHSVHFQCSLFFCVDSDVYPVPFFFCLNFISNSYSVNSGNTFFNFFMSRKAHICLYFWNIFFSCVKSTLSFLFQYFKHITLLSFGLQCFQWGMCCLPYLCCFLYNKVFFPCILLRLFLYHWFWAIRIWCVLV